MHLLRFNCFSKHILGCFLAEMENFAIPRQCECAGQWIHLQLFSHKIEKRRRVLPSNQVKMRCEREFWEHLQNNEGEEQVWEGLLSDYQVFRETGERRKGKERKKAAPKYSQRL